MSEWYYAKDGQQGGPVSADEIRSAVEAKQLSTRDLVWKDGMSDWKKISEIQSLAPAPKVVQQAAPQQRVEAQPEPQPQAWQQQAWQQQAPTQTLAYQQTHHQGPIVLTDRALDMLRQTGPWVRLFGVLIFIGCGFGLLGVGVLFFVALVGFMSNTTAGTGGGILMLVTALFYGGALVLYFFPGLYLNRYASRIRDAVFTRSELSVEQALEAQKSFWKFLGIVFLVTVGLYVLMFLVLLLIGAAGASAGGAGGFGPPSRRGF